MRAAFDYFLCGDPEAAPPNLLQVPDSGALATLPYCTQLELLAGFPSPTWELSVDPTPAQAPQISQHGLVTWQPAASEAGTTFRFTARASNPAGSDSVSWNAAVYPEAFRDDFYGPEPLEALRFQLPQGGPTLTLAGGYAELRHGGTGDSGLNFDTWVGFDRMPRLVLPLRACGDFVVETTLNIVQVTVGGAGPLPDPSDRCGADSTEDQLPACTFPRDKCP